MASIIAPGGSSFEMAQWKYDVFLSFRGEDTRKNFTDHLYAVLYQKGIVTYRDDPSLEKGQNISNELLKAIENSKYLVVIMSRDYASSTWCLEELAKIVECMKQGEQMAIPIFYKVDPSDVRKQRGSFQSAFEKHEVTFKHDMVKVQRWKKAMEEIANLAGWDLLDRHESQFIRDVVEDLQNKLGKKLSYAPKNLVGIQSRMEQMRLHLSLGSNDVRFVGIYGMGGIGKSTLSRALFDEISARFDGCSFLANVREVSNTHGLVHLQNKLLFDVIREKDLIEDVFAGASIIAERLKHKRVLVVLDDVDGIEQLENLATKSWFGQGSRIIITTRDKHLLLIHHADVEYEAKQLSNEEALELFSLKAFGQNNHTEGSTNFSKQVIEYAKGLPLALTVLGSFLSGRSMIEWKSTLARLQDSPNKVIFETLRLSYDMLEEEDKKIFLDIACFYNGKDKDYVMEMLDCFGFHPEIGVEVLIERSLLIVDNNKFMVHDLLREMAWEVVRQESPEELRKRSRLRLVDDINHVMASNIGTERIEGIILESEKTVKVVLNGDCFHKMTKLRLFVIQGANCGVEIKNLSKNLPCLSNKLRLMTLDCFPSSHLPTNFLPESLCELNLRHSHLKQLWNGRQIFQKLKRIDLSHSIYLKTTPDFKTVPNLEKLIMRCCESLFHIDPSMGVLDKLELLDLSECKNLRKLPPSIGNLRSLEVLRLGGCSNLKELPDSICSLEGLEELDLSSTAISHHPPNSINLKNFKESNSREVNGIWRVKAHNPRGMLSPSQSRLSPFEVLYYGNYQEGGISNDPHLGCLSSPRNLGLSSNDILTIPKSISRIPRLERLNLSCRSNLQALPKLPESILYVEVKDCMMLHSISNLFIVCSSNQMSDICLMNCLKFLPEDLEIPLARKYSLALLYYIIGYSMFPSYRGTYVVAPNTEMPKWFTYQKDGSLLSFRIRYPRFIDKASGFVVCVSFLRPKHLKDSYDLICEFNVGGNPSPLSFRFPIRFIASNSLWMGFVPMFQDYRKWDEIIDVLIEVSLWTVDDQLKVMKSGILPLQKWTVDDQSKLMKSASLPLQKRTVDDRSKVKSRGLRHLLKFSADDRLKVKKFSADDQLKVKQIPHTFKKFIQSGSSSPEDMSSIFHELAYQKGDYHFLSSGDNKEIASYFGVPKNATTCGVSIGSESLKNAKEIYNLWCNEFKRD